LLSCVDGCSPSRLSYRNDTKLLSTKNEDEPIFAFWSQLSTTNINIGLLLGYWSTCNLKPTNASRTIDTLAASRHTCLKRTEDVVRWVKLKQREWVMANRHPCVEVQGDSMSVAKQTLLRLADGRHLDVIESGPVDGPVVVFHHGTPGTPIGAVSTAAHRLGLRFVTMWRPGYGESTRQPGRSVLDVASDTAAVLDFLGVNRCLVAGWSGGGPHALACAAQLPERVAAVTVIAGFAPYGAGGLDWMANMTAGNSEGYGLAVQGEAAQRPPLELGRTQILQATREELQAAAENSFAPVDQAVLAGEVGNDLAANFHEALRVGADGWIDDCLAIVRPWGFSVTEITTKTLLWHGTEDHLVPVAHGKWLAERIPSVVAHFEHGEGHMSIGSNNLDQILQELLAASIGQR
jgi:pimeloyl-ACP methyl ester carboxylesterase